MYQTTTAQDTLVSAKTYVNYLDSVYERNQPQAFKQLEAYLNSKKEKEFSDKDLDEIYYALAKYSSRAFDFGASKKYAKKGLQHIKTNNLTVTTSGYYNLLGGVTYFDNKLDSAAYYFVQSLKAMEEQGENDKLPFISNNIANIYSEQGNNEKALFYFKKAYILLQSNPETINSKLIAPLCGNLAYTYFKLDSIDKALTFADEALVLAKKYNNLQGSAVSYNVKSLVAQKEMKEDSAYIYLLKAYDIANEEKNNYQIAFTATNMSILLAKSNPKEAVRFGEIAYKMNNDGKKGNMLYKNIRTLGSAYYTIGNFKKAATFQRDYIRYQDSLFNADYNQKTIEVLEKYQASQKELTITQQEAEISEKENQQRTLTIIIIALGILTLLGFLFFRQRQKIQKQKIKALENEKENVALRSLMSGEEKERSRIAKEIHDGLGGILAAAKMLASKGIENQKVVELLDTASKESRRISHNLLPESLMAKGLDKALRDFVASINDTGLLETNYHAINVESNLPQALQLSVYRIVQELLNNIIKHANATEAFVQLQQEKKKLIITVEDNGKGFLNTQSSDGIGLTNIKSRLSLLKGKLEIDSNETSGTSVYIELQLEK